MKLEIRNESTHAKEIKWEVITRFAFHEKKKKKSPFQEIYFAFHEVSNLQQDNVWKVTLFRPKSTLHTVPYDGLFWEFRWRGE